MEIGLLLYPSCMPAGLFAFADLMAAANQRAGKRLFNTFFIGLRRGDIQCAHGMVLPVNEALGSRSLDALLVPGLWAGSLTDISMVVEKNRNLLEAIGLLPSHTKIWSYCTGVILPAHAGKLDRHRATVTWWLSDLLRTQYPKVHWEIEKTCVFHGNVATASGTGGYLEIAQTIIKDTVSPDVLQDLIIFMVLPRPEKRHPAFQSFSLIAHSSPILRRLHALAEQMPATELSVERLALELHMTERTLARRVRETSGMTIAAFMRRVKLDQVSERLMSTSLSGSAISADLGFSSDSAMARMFKELTSLTLNEYRRKFGNQ